MQLGMIGLGRMGGGMVQRLVAGGHECVVHDRSAEVMAALAGEDVVPADDLARLVERLEAPRAVWLMLPAAVVDATLDALVPLLEPGDTVIDGGNSYYVDDLRRAGTLGERGLHYVDVGTSGGLFGRERGYCLMIGGEPETVSRLEPLFATLAPGTGAIPRTGGLEGPPSSAEKGYFHCGPSGAGHFVKMVHNGIEYGVMAAYAEGLSVLRGADIGHRSRAADAETAPLREPDHYKYDFDVPRIAELWRRGSVISSWLLDLTATALVEDPELAALSGRVSDSGEGRWTIKAAIDEAVPTPVLSAALYERFSSRGQSDFADRVLSAMRREFGGHLEKPPGEG